MQIIEINHLDSLTKTQLLTLWNAEYPSDIKMNSIADFNGYLSKLSAQYHLLLLNDQNEIRGWAFSFERENERWFGIILSDEVQKKGYGREMLVKLKSREIELNGWIIDHGELQKLDGSNYESPLGFYCKCGFELLREETREHNQITMVKIKWKNDQ